MGGGFRVGGASLCPGQGGEYTAGAVLAAQQGALTMKGPLGSVLLEKKR